GAGADTEVINLRDYPIEFCLNCRECTQQAGRSPGRCVLDDGMHQLIDKIEASQAYVLASPTNFSSVTAIFKRFMERLVVYAYWPWDKPYPKFRKQGLIQKKAMLISSSAAPSWMGRWLFGTGRQLDVAAKTIGAKSVGTLFTGQASSEKHQRLTQQSIDRARGLAIRLIAV
ncbi:MAG: flavodoxin family protein, partial [Gammaproteobacteria bacterium]|nr:flavodoxin family protein [Gammaproteobacteria bacterium]